MTEQNNMDGKLTGRVAKWSDISAIEDLGNASPQITRGTNETPVHWQKRQLCESGIDLDENSLLISDGFTGVAYGEFVAHPTRSRIFYKEFIQTK